LYLGAVSDLELSDWKRRKTEGPRLHYALCRAEKPRGAVAVVHGYADYAERCARPMKAFAARGLTSVAIDLRGHGRSEGVRGHAMSFNDFIDDFRELVAILDEKAPGLPRVLFAHSFGTPVSIKSILAGVGDFRAVALSQPYLATAFEVPAIKMLAGKIASRLVPAFGLPSGLQGSQMTDDPEEARKYDTDPLIFKNARARWFTETLAAQEEVVRRAGELKMPLLVMFSTNDSIAKDATARAFFDRVASPDKKWESLPGLKHEPLNDPVQGEAIAGRIGDWLASKI
jgi:alpha-beta hydrolase superfamily lysophospholipase